MATIALPERTITLATRVVDGSPKIETVLTITAGELTLDEIADGLTAGQSPRVAWQSRARDDGIPTSATITWDDFVNPARRPRRAAKPTLETATRDANRLTDDEKRALAERIMASIGK